MQNSLSGKRALIIGGSGGIGRAVTFGLAAAGVSVEIHGGHDERKLATAADEAQRLGIAARTHLAAIETGEQGVELLRQAGEIDILVVSYGPYVEAKIHETPTETIRAMTELNLTMPMMVASAAIPQMRKRGGGSILLFGSPRGGRIEGYDRIAVYAAAKIGLASFVRSVARQYAGDSIRCNMICPGYVETEYYSPDRVVSLAQQRPQGRMATPNEVAALALYLLGDAAEPVNGAIIPVDFGE